ncbi:MAG: tetratricopeptide repeat protein [Gammaproteobacteria bacterium]|nr:tetratricopeptide repeat protein [Gammaproteobacteria bacterium]
MHLPILLIAATLVACSSQVATLDSLPDRVAIEKTPARSTQNNEALLDHSSDRDFDRDFDRSFDRSRAIAHYRQFLELAPGSPMYPRAMKRLAELEMLSAEERDSNTQQLAKQNKQQVKNAIEIYKTYLRTYPQAKDNDQILYQLAKAYELVGDIHNSITTLSQLTNTYPYSRYFDEAHFRRGEILFSLQKYPDAERAFRMVNTRKYSNYKVKALYKHAWSLFKQSKYQQALSVYFKLLQEKSEYSQINQLEYTGHIVETEKSFLNDVLRATALSLSYEDGVNTLKQHMPQRSEQPFEALLYDRLGHLYLDKQRHIDAAETYLAYVDKYPANSIAPNFHESAIKAYQASGISLLVLSSKEDFINRYGVGTEFWSQHDTSVRDSLRPMLISHVKDLSTHYHATAQKTKKQPDFKKAIYWYQHYIQAFKTEADVAQTHFLLAEALQESGRYEMAIEAFEKTAYDYPAHKQSADAAYAALLLYPIIDKNKKTADRLSWKTRQIDHSLRFADTFPEHKHALPVLIKTAELLYSKNNYIKATLAAEKSILRFKPKTNPGLKKTAWTVLGHASFDNKDYLKAESAYKSALKLTPKKDMQYASLTERYAASIYKQAAQLREQGETQLAVATFLRIGVNIPQSKIRWTADYDAASLLIQTEKWSQAQPVLERLRKHYPNKHKMQANITEKLAFVYNKSGQPVKAAREMENLASASSDPKYRQEILWQTAELYQSNNRNIDAARIYQKYLKQKGSTAERTLEAQYALAEHFDTRKDAKSARHWYKKLISTDKTAGKKRTERSRFLAATATVKLAKPIHHTYKKARLTVPLKKSLKRKKALMKKTLTAYEKALKYKVADINTSATYEIAEIYHDFSRSLMKSQRPKNLAGEELEQYDILLEEQAYPFEEKAIDIHIANLKHMQQGIYDQWIKNSLGQLKKLQPARFSKEEVIDDYVSTTN